MAGDQERTTGNDENRTRMDVGVADWDPRGRRARRWLQSKVGRRAPAQGLVEYAFSIISVVALAVAFWALLQVAMNAMGQRAVTAVNDVK